MPVGVQKGYQFLFLGEPPASPAAHDNDRMRPENAQDALQFVTAQINLNSDLDVRMARHRHLASTLLDKIERDRRVIEGWEL